MRQLQELARQATHPGPVVLFSGPSGTGKTLAAEGLARRLEMPLFRIDLGMLVSKYIGETEKNLNALFDSAAGAEVVLLFDEADSLLGKRTETRDASDRYANLEVSYLLQRIEEYAGIVILATNLPRNMDPAFVRRLDCIIDFPFPDEAARERIWELHLPPRASRAEDVDLGAVARAVKLTGSQIKNASLHATMLANEDEDVVRNAHIARAIWRELQREDRDARPSSLGDLADHLRRDP